MDENFDLLQEAITKEFEKLSAAEDDETRKAIVARIKDLYTLRLSELNERNDYEAKDDDKDIKLKQLDVQKRDQYLKMILWAGGNLISSLFLIGAFKFEEKGTFASWLTKTLFQKNVKINQ